MRIVCSLVSVTAIFQLELFIILNVNYRNVCSSNRPQLRVSYSPEAVSAPPGELILGTGKWTISIPNVSPNLTDAHIIISDYMKKKSKQ